MTIAEDWANFHDGLCGVALKDGPCSCHVAVIVKLTEERDRYKKALENIATLDAHLGQCTATPVDGCPSPGIAKKALKP